MNFHFFPFILLILSLKYMNLELQMKFYKYNSLQNDFFFSSIDNFVKYFIENTFSTDILIGDPPQKIQGCLNPDQSIFYLTNKKCLSKKRYNSQKSSNFIFIQNITSKYYSLYRFSDSLSLESTTNPLSIQDITINYEFLSDCELTQSLCFVVGTKLVSSGENLEDNLLSRLHTSKNIKSYYFSFNLNSRKEDEIIYIFDINENNINGYTFIKTSSYSQNNKQYLVWGLNFEKIIFDNDIIYENNLRAEFNINLGCIIASNAFKEKFDKFLRNNYIMTSLNEYSKKYYIYIFEEKYYDALKNFTIDFYHKELNYHFTLNYQDLFYEEYNKIYCLIVFNYKEKNFWKFGLPFFRKYRFIYNQDTKSIGFFNDNNDEKKKRNDRVGDKKYYRINGKVIGLIVVIFVFIIVAMVFFGVLIGKKIYKVRKNKTNELLELYDYNSKSEK